MQKVLGVQCDLSHRTLKSPRVKTTKTKVPTGAVEVGQLLGALMLGSPPRPGLLLLGDGAVGVGVVLQHRVLQDLLLSLDGGQDLVGHEVQVLVGEDLLDALRTGQREGHLWRRHAHACVTTQNDHRQTGRLSCRGSPRKRRDVTAHCTHTTMPQRDCRELE